VLPFVGLVEVAPQRRRSLNEIASKRSRKGEMNPKHRYRLEQACDVDLAGIRSRTPNFMLWPAAAQGFPSAPLTFPALMMPIFMAN